MGMDVKMKSLLFAKEVWIFCQCNCFGQKSNLTLISEWDMNIYDCGIVLNIFIPPLVTSCKILIINVNFLAALEVRKGWFQTLLLPLWNSNFWDFPLSQVSVVLPSANNVVNAFFCFVLSPIVAVAKTQLFRQTLSKPGCESNILVIFFNFCHSLTTSINLHGTSTFFMLDNELQRTIYTLASIKINIVQYLRNRHTFPKLTVTQIESNVRNFLRNNLLEISSFYRKRRINKSRKKRDEETK